MLDLILFYLSISLAAFFNAVMDTLAHHYYTSVFRDWNCKVLGRRFDERFWNPVKSSEQLDYVHIWFIKTKYRPDAWHLAKSLMIIVWAVVAVKGAPYLLFVTLPKEWMSVAGIMITIGFVWNAVFNLFYNKVLLKKKKLK